MSHCFEVSAIASGVLSSLCFKSTVVFPVLGKCWRAFRRKLVVIVQGKLFLFQNCSVVLFMNVYILKLPMTIRFLLTRD